MKAMKGSDPIGLLKGLPGDMEHDKHTRRRIATVEKRLARLNELVNAWLRRESDLLPENTPP